MERVTSPRAAKRPREDADDEFVPNDDWLAAAASPEPPAKRAHLSPGLSPKSVSPSRIPATSSRERPSGVVADAQAADAVPIPDRHRAGYYAKEFDDVPPKRRKFKSF